MFIIDSNPLSPEETYGGMCDTTGVGRYRGRSVRLDSVPGLGSYITTAAGCGCCITVFEKSEVYVKTALFETSIVQSATCVQRLELYDSTTRTTSSICESDTVPALVGCSGDRRMYFLHYVNDNRNVGVRFSVTVEGNKVFVYYLSLLVTWPLVV